MRPSAWQRQIFLPTSSTVLLVLLLCGCASSPPKLAAPQRPFNFKKDTFAYANQLDWIYHYDEKGKWTGHPIVPRPTYKLHCFVVARSAKQFFDQARFDPSLPVADAATYRRLIRRVVTSPAKRVRPEAEKIVIPGYPDLRSFSAAQEKLLKQECGGAWESYLQHGNWRMIMHFSRHHQEMMAEQMREELRLNLPVVAHLAIFPALTMNHAVLLFGMEESEKEIRFKTYDPNDPDAPRTLTYDRATRTFKWQRTEDFPGGSVNVYEVYHDFWH
jgi:hypothetical protein